MARRNWGLERLNGENPRAHTNSNPAPIPITRQAAAQTKRSHKLIYYFCCPVRPGACKRRIPEVSLVYTPPSDRKMAARTRSTSEIHRPARVCCFTKAKSRVLILHCSFDSPYAKRSLHVGRNAVHNAYHHHDLLFRFWRLPAAISFVKAFACGSFVALY